MRLYCSPISPCPLVITAAKRLFNSLTMTPESRPAGGNTAVTAAAGSVRGEELQAQGFHRGAGHGGAAFGVFHQLGTASRQIAICLTGNIVERRSQRRNQSYRGSVGGFTLSRVLSLRRSK